MLIRINHLQYIIRDNPEIAKYLTIEMLFQPDMIKIFADITARHFHDRKDTITFLRCAWASSERLSKKVLSGNFKPNYYKHVVINERGKSRDITPPSFETKIVQKIICAFVLREPLEADMIEGSYATVKGKGTDLMYREIVNMLNTAIKAGYKRIVLTDFANYFGSIQRNLLRQNVFEKFVYQETLIDLMMTFFMDREGLILGNEISQLPASYYVTPFDKYVTDEMKIPYKRFMDDTIALCKNKKEEKEYIDIFKKFTDDLGLAYKKEKLKTYGLGADFVFCKERFFYNRQTGEYYQVINQKRIKTECRKLKAINSSEELIKQYRSVRGCFAKHPNSKRILAELDALYKRRLEEVQSNEIKQATKGKEYDCIMHLYLYYQGSCCGGYGGYVFHKGKRRKTIRGNIINTTKTRFEILALTEAIDKVTVGNSLDSMKIYVNSDYLIRRFHDDFDPRKEITAWQMLKAQVEGIEVKLIEMNTHNQYMKPCKSVAKHAYEKRYVC